MMVRILLLLACTATSGCGAGLMVASAATLPLAIGASSQLGKQGASSVDAINRMNCTQLRAEYQRTKGFSINPVNGVRHASTIDAMRARGCRFPS